MVQALKEKGVVESRILLLTLIAAPEGIKKLCSDFPEICVITSEVDEKVDEHSRVVPGGLCLYLCCLPDVQDQPLSRVSIGPCLTAVAITSCYVSVIILSYLAETCTDIHTLGHASKCSEFSSGCIKV